MVQFFSQFSSGQKILFNWDHLILNFVLQNFNFKILQNLINCLLHHQIKYGHLLKLEKSFFWYLDYDFCNLNRKYWSKNCSNVIIFYLLIHFIILKIIFIFILFFIFLRWYKNQIHLLLLYSKDSNFI